MPWICQFKVLTLLPLSEITVSCWVSISMGLLSNTSSSILVFASPIVLTEIVICGGCPNFIFLANCCWKTRKENTKKKRYLYYQQNKPSLARAPSPPASCTETFKATSDSGQKKINLRLTLLQHEGHPLFLLPTKWPRSGIYCMISDFGWSTWVLVNVAQFCKLTVNFETFLLFF